MKRKLFIGSSSESLETAKQVKAAIDERCSEWLETILWNETGVFKLEASTLECLVKKSRVCDYGVFIAAADDRVLMRRRVRRATRDNVILELGMFMGSLGLNRAFVATSVELPSDMNGVTLIKYKNDRLSNDNIEQLVAGIEATKDSYQLGHRQSTALALGYFKNYVKPAIDKLAQDGSDFSFAVFVPNNISDLPNRISRHVIETGSAAEKIDDNGRNIYKLTSGMREYWDIPRLLRTLEDLVSFYEPSQEPGANHAYDELLAIELDNFCNVLVETNRRENSYHEKVHILRVDC